MTKDMKELIKAIYEEWGWFTGSWVILRGLLASWLGVPYTENDIPKERYEND